ncbi:ComEA family DNA-binding protein [Comamonas composti]|uniref:ComEA family DNA-binding protein n=1 Tax=Comamonas composti TaxID=408558 RepID=UPI0004235328|nr:helix-hairpin-helix domain-containing protein [Comamonas composti]
MFARLIAGLVALIWSAMALAAVDVNKGSAADLDSVKGIGPAMSSRILEERKNGQFKDWTDFISRVKGIGDASATKLSAQGLTVNGGSYQGDATKVAKHSKASKADAKPAAVKDSKASAKPAPAPSGKTGASS